jgi:hypothetical protein
MAETRRSKLFFSDSMQLSSLAIADLCIDSVDPRAPMHAELGILGTSADEG